MINRSLYLRSSLRGSNISNSLIPNNPKTFSTTSISRNIRNNTLSQKDEFDYPADREVAELMSLIDGGDPNYNEPDIQIPSKIPTNQNLLELQLNGEHSFKNQFIDFNTNNILINLLSEKLPTDLINIKDEYESMTKDTDELNLHTNDIDLLMKYSKKFKLDLNSVDDLKPGTNRTIFPSELELEIKDLINSSQLSIKELLNYLKLKPELNRYSSFNLISGLISSSPVIPTNTNNKVFLQSLIDYINNNELLFEFENDEFETIIHQLIELKELDLLNSLISNRNSNTSVESFFFDNNRCSYSLKTSLLQLYIELKDFQISNKLLNSLISNNICPPLKLIESYLELVDTVAKSLESSYEDKKLIFTVYSSLISYLLKNQSDLLNNNNIMRLLLNWMNKNEISLFLNYLSNNNSNLKILNIEFHQLIIREFCSRLLSESSSSPSYYNSIELTALLNHLTSKKLFFNEFNDDTIKLIVQQYCRFGSAIGAKLWMNKLTNKLSSNEVNEYINLLQTIKFNKEDEIEGFDQIHINNLISHLQQSL